MPLTRRITAALIWLAAGLLGLLVLLHLILPGVLRYQLEDTLHPRPGQGTYLGDINLNLFSGLLTIDDVVLGEPGREYLRAAHLVLDIDTPALLGGRLRVQEFALDNGFWRVIRNPDGSVDPGVPLPSPGAAEPSSPAVALLIESARLRHFRLRCLDRKSGLPEQRLLIERIELHDFDPAATREAPLTARLQWGSAQVALDARLATAKGISLVGTIKARRFPLDKSMRLARTGLPISGVLDSMLKLRLKEGQLSLSGELSGEGLGYRPEGMTAALQRLSVGGLGLQLPLGRPGQLSFSGKLSGDGLRYEAEGQAATLQHLSVGSMALQLPLEHPRQLTLKVGPVASDALSLNLGQQQLDVSEGRLQGEWHFYQAENKLSQKGLALGLKGVKAAQSGQQAQLDTLALELLPGDIGLDRPELQGTLAVGGIQLSHPSLGDDRFQVGSLHTSGWQWRQDQLFIDEAKAQALAFAHYPLHVAKVSLGRSIVSGRQLALGPVVISDAQGELQRKADGQWVLPVVKPDAATTEQAQTSAPHIRLAGVTFEGLNRIHLIDRSVKPALDQKIRIETLQLGALDSTRPQADTPLELVLRPDTYSQLRLQASLRPFAPSFRIDTKGVLQGLHLPLVNGLVANDLGHRFLDGELEDKFELEIAENKLHMQNALRLERLDVEAIKGKEGPPLALAIALLEDRQGRISLEVPIDGDLDNPNFRVLGALNPVIMKAVAGTAALAIQPLGSVLLVGGLLAGEALKVSFDPALFQAKRADLAPGMGSKLRELGASSPTGQNCACACAVSLPRPIAARARRATTWSRKSNSLRWRSGALRPSAGCCWIPGWRRPS